MTTPKLAPSHPPRFGLADGRWHCVCERSFTSVTGLKAHTRTCEVYLSLPSPVLLAAATRSCLPRIIAATHAQCPVWPSPKP